MSKTTRYSPRSSRLAGRYVSPLAGVGLAFQIVMSAPTAAAEPDAVPAQSASSAAAANPPVAELSEIVVTAQRREERMQSIPATVSAVSADTLEQANIKSVADIGKLVPGTMIQETVGTATVFVRGIGSNQLGYGNSASNAIYIDGVYQTRVSPVILRLNSIERIEVLEGPQGTLFGRNSESGLVQVVTRTPELNSSPHIEANLGYGNFRTFESDLYASSGLGSNLAADVSVVYDTQQDGFGHNSFLGTDAFKGWDYAVRTKWVFEPTDGTKFIATGYYSETRGDQSLFGYYAGDGAPPRAYPLGSNNLNPPSSPYDRLNGVPQYIDSTYYGASLRASQELSFADLISISSLARIKEDAVDDADFSPVNFLLDVNTAYDHTFTQELQLVSKNTSAISWVTGAYYLDQSYGYPTQNLSGDSVIPVPGATILAPAGGNTKSYALYGQATFPIWDRFSLTLGGRYAIDHLAGFGAVDLDLPGAGIISVQPFGRAGTTTRKPLWKDTLEYKLAEDALVYFTNSRGTKSGAFNLVTFDPVPLKPETLDAYEVGFKSQSFNRRLRLNGALFYYDITDPQVFQTTTIGTDRLVNAGSARVKGAELQVEGAVTSDLTLRAAVTYLDATYKDYANAPFFYPNVNPPYGNLPAVAGDASGNRLSRAPRVSGNLGAQYRIPMSSGEFALSANYSYTSEYFWDADNLVRQPSYGVLDARIAYNFNSGLHVAVWGTNLTNKLYYLAENQFGSPMGSEGFPAPPRLYGVTVGFKY